MKQSGVHRCQAKMSISFCRNSLQPQRMTVRTQIKVPPSCLASNVDEVKWFAENQKVSRENLVSM